jgi:glycosyltransferase involved in cell wall biosynthesis
MSTDPVVLHVVEAVEAGVLRHVADLVAAVAGQHHVAMPTVRRGGRTDAELVARIASAGAEIHPLGLTRFPVTPSNAWAAAKLRRLVGRLRPDVVHLHSSIAGAVGRVALIGRRVPAVYTPNGVSPSRLARTVERGLGRRADAIVAVSASESRLINDLGWSAPARVHVIPNGIEGSPPAPEGPSLRARLGLGPDDLLIGAVGRLTAQKAPEVVLAAWGQVLAARPDVTAVWIGDGVLRSEAEALSARVGAGRLHLLGHVPGAGALVGELDLLCLGSRFEGLPYAPLEAMRAGVAVIGTDVVGTRDVLDHDRTGLLVPPDDPEALAAAVLALLDDPARRARLAAAGRAAQQERFSLEGMAAAVTQLYATVRSGVLPP